MDDLICLIIIVLVVSALITALAKIAIPLGILLVGAAIFIKVWSQCFGSKGKQHDNATPLS